MPRRNTWSVVERCMALLVRLTRGPASTSELLQIIESYGDHAENSSTELLSKRLEKDLQKLRTHFGCVVDYNRSANCYVLVGMDRPLTDLSADAMRGLAFLKMTFNDASAPMSREVTTLADAVLMLISDTGREEVDRVRGLIEVDLRQRDEDKIHKDVWDAIEKACHRNCELEFEYMAPRHEDSTPRTHRVEPIHCTFDSTRAHYYLEAYCIEHRGPNGIFPGEAIWHYRLGRISAPRILPKRFVPGQRKPKKYELVYELAPEIARGGVTRHIADCEVEKKPDGGAIVRAASMDLFFDLQTLLHYGANCRVLGGEEALQRIRDIVKKMSQNYLNT